MFKAFRIFVLLMILAGVGGTALMQRWQAQSWRRTQVITLYPINIDGDAGTDAYLDRLDEHAFAGLAPYFQSEAHRYGVALDRPIRIELGRRVHALPPAVPHERGMLAAMTWSLRMRWWAWRNTPPSSPIPDVRLFLLYHPASTTGALPHSTGLEKGRMGLVHLFASKAQEAQNEVVLAHEALHTFGATDKYEFDTLMPSFPDGYAEPDLQPSVPQTQAELMAGRIPVGASQVRMPAGLSQTVIGKKTATEIGWIKP